MFNVHRSPVFKPVSVRGLFCCLPAHNSDVIEAGRIITSTNLFHNFTAKFFDTQLTQFTLHEMISANLLSRQFSSSFSF